VVHLVVLVTSAEDSLVALAPILPAALVDLADQMTLTKDLMVLDDLVEALAADLAVSRVDLVEDTVAPADTMTLPVLASLTSHTGIGTLLTYRVVEALTADTLHLPASRTCP
jgi:hypothetical protein